MNRTEIVMDTRDRLTAVREEGTGHWMTDGEEISQRTYMHNPQTQSKVG